MAEDNEKRYVSDNAQHMAEWDRIKNNKLALYPNNITCGALPLLDDNDFCNRRLYYGL